MEFKEIRDVVVGRLSTSGGNLCVHICESQLRRPERRKANTAFSRSSSGLGESEDVRGYEILPQAPKRCHTMEDVGRWTRRCLRTSLYLNSIVDAVMVEVARCLSLCVSHALSSAAAHSLAEQFGATSSHFSRLSRPITFISRHLLTSLLTNMSIYLLLRTISFLLD